MAIVQLKLGRILEVVAQSRPGQQERVGKNFVSGWVALTPDAIEMIQRRCRLYGTAVTASGVSVKVYTLRWDTFALLAAAA